MPTGKLKPDNNFSPDDHRAFVQMPASHLIGAKLSLADYNTGLYAVDELKAICPAGIV
jgi:hypothetical protein